MNVIRNSGLLMNLRGVWADANILSQMASRRLLYVGYYYVSITVPHKRYKCEKGAKALYKTIEI